jgi:hypothetical protein
MNWNEIEEQLIDNLLTVVKLNGDPFNVLWYCFEAVEGSLGDDHAARREMVRSIKDRLARAQVELDALEA